MAEKKGFEPLRRLPDLPVFKTGPFSQTWVLLHIGASGRTWTGTWFDSRRILSPVRLPIPPLKHVRQFALDYLIVIYFYYFCNTFFNLFNKKTLYKQRIFKNGVSYATWTHDPLIKSQVLYRLS